MDIIKKIDKINKKIKKLEEKKMKFELKGGKISNVQNAGVVKAEESHPAAPSPFDSVLNAPQQPTAQPLPTPSFTPQPQIDPNRQAQIMAQMQQQQEELRQQMMQQQQVQEVPQEEAPIETANIIIYLTEGQVMEPISVELDSIQKITAFIDKAIVEQTIFKFGTHTINALYIKRYEVA